MVEKVEQQQQQQPHGLVTSSQPKKREEKREKKRTGQSAVNELRPSGEKRRARASLNP